MQSDPDNLYMAPFNFDMLSKKKIGILTNKHIYETKKGYPCKVHRESELMSVCSF